MQHISTLPNEICSKPEPLVVLFGLDIEKNPIHRSIWRAFNTNRPRDRGTFNFRCKPFDHQFPRPKYKPTGSSEWFLPKGILKTGWMRKHIDVIPALVALFYDLDWDEQNWEEKSVECARLVDTIRSKLTGRDSKLVIVLIQKRAPLPMGEDLNAMDRAQSLCTKCDLPGKNLFVLSHTNLLYGCVTRLEDEFHDMTANYYYNQAKKVKAHKDSLNKTSHQLLFVRYEFKIAFYSELKQDPTLALKHYLQAYTHLTELRMLDAHMLEVKTVASFINYKICRLSFQINASDAISQFRRHINFFSNLVGLSQLAFEHEAWMSKQFEILGDLFQEAIRSSLTALMTQHPGLYYQEAARHAIGRRQLCQAICMPIVKSAQLHLEEEDTVFDNATNTVVGIDVTLIDETGGGVSTEHDSPIYVNDVNKVKSSVLRSQSPFVSKNQTTTPVLTSPAAIIKQANHETTPSSENAISATEKVSGLEFFGQRPWRQGIQSIEPPDATKEREGILTLQKAEFDVDHSEIIIHLLEQAHIQYKRYKAERMKLYPCVLMGSEYYDKQNYDKSLNCYLKAIDDYRREKWWLLYTSTLKRIATCAYLCVQPASFISACLELIGPNSLLCVTEKLEVQKALTNLLKGDVPNLIMFAPELDHNLKTIEQSWKVELDNMMNKYAKPRSIDPSTTDSNRSVDCGKADDLQMDLSNFDSLLSLDISNLNTCVQCKVCFTESQYVTGQPVQLAVFLRSHAPLPIHINHVKVNFLSNVDMPVSDNATTNLNRSTTTAPPPPHQIMKQSSQIWLHSFVLEKDETAKVILFTLDPEILGRQIKISSVHLGLKSALQNQTPDSQHSLNASILFCSISWQLLNESDYNKSTAEQKHLQNQQKKIYTTTNSIKVKPTRGLWNSDAILSRPERKYQHSLCKPLHFNTNTPVIVPDGSGGDGEDFPHFPLKWDLVGIRPHVQIHHPTSCLKLHLPKQLSLLANKTSTLDLSVINQTINDCTQLSLTVRLGPDSSVVNDANQIPLGSTMSSAMEHSNSAYHLIQSDQLNPETQLVVGDYNEFLTHCGESKYMNAFSKQLSDIVVATDSNAVGQLNIPITLRCANPSTRLLICHLSYVAKLSTRNNEVCHTQQQQQQKQYDSNHSPHRRHCYYLFSIKNSNVYLIQSIQPLWHNSFGNANKSVEIHCTQTIESNLTVLPAWTVQLQTLSILQNPIQDLVMDEEFILQITMQNVSNYELKIEDVKLDLPTEIQCKNTDDSLIVKDLLVQSLALCTNCYLLIVACKPQSDNISLGRLVIHWKLTENKHLVNASTTSFILPSCPLFDLPIKCRIELPPFGVQLSALPVIFILENRTIYPQEIVIKMETSNQFMYSGQQKLRMKLLPDTPHSLHYTLLPLTSGMLKLPRLRLSLARMMNNTVQANEQLQSFRFQIEENILRQLPTRLLVVPSKDSLHHSGENKQLNIMLSNDVIKVD